MAQQATVATYDPTTKTPTRKTVDVGSKDAFSGGFGLEERIADPKNIAPDKYSSTYKVGGVDYGILKKNPYVSGGSTPVDTTGGTTGKSSVAGMPILTPTSTTPTIPTTPVIPGQGLTDVQKKLTTPQDPTSQADAYTQLTSQAQGEIAKIEQYYASLTAEAERAGGVRESSANAMALAAGMAGSGTAASALEKEKGATRAEKQTITGQLASKIAEVYSNIRSNSISLAQLGQAELGQAETVRQDIQNKAKESLNIFASGGISADIIKQKDPQLYQNLIEQSGMSDYQMAAYIDNNKDNPNKPTIKEVPMPSPDGKSTILRRITFDPVTGKSKEQDFTVNVPFATYDGKAITTTSDGKLLQQQPDGTYKDITPGITGGTTTSQKDYEYYSKQETAAGRTPLTFEQYQSAAKAPAAVKEFMAAQAGGFKGTIMDYQAQKKGGGGLGLDADTINFMAEQYIASPGQAIPSFGQGAAGMAARAQFYNAVANAAEAKGLSGQALAARKAGSTAAQSALTKITTLTAATKAAEKAAISNLDLAYKLGQQYERTGYPTANRFTNWLNGQVGDAQLSAFETALYTGAREYAKVSSGAAGSVAGLTDSATKEAERLVNAAMTQGQLKSTLDTMKADMKNVEEAQNSTLAGLRDQISGGVNTDTTPTQTVPGSGPTPATGSEVPPLF